MRRAPPIPAPAASATLAACASFQEFVATDCPLTWNGITLYGAYDVGVGWVSHGLPENGYNYEGESLVNRNGNHSRFLIAPNNLSQTGLGIKGKVEFMDGWYVVFNASTGINPQSGQLANMAATNTTNNGLPRGSYSDNRRRRARGPTLQRRTLWRRIVGAIRHADLRSSARSRYRCDARLRSGRRRLLLFVHRV